MKDLGDAEANYLAQVLRLTGNEDRKAKVVKVNWHFLKSNVKNATKQLEINQNEKNFGDLAFTIAAAMSYVGVKIFAAVIKETGLDQNKYERRMEFLSEQFKLLIQNAAVCLPRYPLPTPIKQKWYTSPPQTASKTIVNKSTPAQGSNTVVTTANRPSEARGIQVSKTVPAVAPSPSKVNEVEAFLKNSSTFKSLKNYYTAVLNNDIRSHDYFCGMINLKLDKASTLNNILDQIENTNTISDLRELLDTFYQGKRQAASQYEFLNKGQNITTRFFNGMGMKSSTIKKMDEFREELESYIQTYTNSYER